MKEIVIKIPWEVADAFINDRANYIQKKALRDALTNGKVLPKGHGRLIDADKYVKSICNCCDGSCDFVGCDCLNCHEDCRCDFAKEMDDVDVLLEADKTESEEE